MGDLGARLDQAEQTLEEERGGPKHDITFKIVYDKTVRDEATGEVRTVSESLPDSEYIFGGWSERGPDGKRYRVMQPTYGPTPDSWGLLPSGDRIAVQWPIEDSGETDSQSVDARQFAPAESITSSDAALPVSAKYPQVHRTEEK